MRLMTDRKKVLKGLECCWQPEGERTVRCHCTDCPYGEMNDIFGQICRANLNRDALELLKEPEPHLMTVDELEALPVGAVVWEEYLDAELGITELEPAMKIRGAIMAESGYSTIMEGMGDADVDGNAWRWWSSKPTEEQRKAVSWNELG